MRNNGGLAVLGGVVVVVLGIRAVVGIVVDGLSSDKVAWLITLFVLSVAGVALFILWMVGRMWSIRQSSGYSIGGYERDDEPEPEHYASPPRLQRRNVPVIRVRGEAVPGDDVPQLETSEPALLEPPTELTSIVHDKTGERFEVSAVDDDVRQFVQAMWPKPSQKLWRGDTQRYGRTADFLIQHGLLVRVGRSYEWQPGVTKQRAERWISSL